MIDKLSAALSAIIPPAEANPRALARWRLSMAAFVFAFCFHVAWACGYIPGLPGFAQARDLTEQRTLVQQVSEGQEAILVRLIRADIESARQQQCRALRENNRAAAEGWAVSLRTALAEYQSLAGAEYRLRECSEY